MNTETKDKKISFEKQMPHLLELFINCYYYEAS